ncbi:hypothetical protein ABFT23_03110 [Nocardioides sp. C4-1]|uniref:TolB family protein n=1 Tax=Nocardioides sp. C4-1 TaxID=3151851 RepID=UPI0032676984
MRARLGALVAALAVLALAAPVTPVASASGPPALDRAAPVSVRWQVPARARVGTTVTTRLRLDRASDLDVRVDVLVNGRWQLAGRSLLSGRRGVVRFTQLAGGPTRYRLSGVGRGELRTQERTVRGTGTAPALSTRRLSVTARGAQVNGSSYDGTASSDGRYVAFTSLAQNLLPRPAATRRANVYLKDTRTGAVRRVSHTRGGDAATGPSTQPAISGDGRVVAFVSRAGNLVKGDRNRKPDVFVWNRSTDLVTRVGTDATAPSISDDGRFVAFTARGAGTTRVEVRDRRTGRVSRLGRGASPSISGNGRLVVFADAGRVLLRDRTSGTTRVVAASGQHPQVSADGSTVAYEAAAGGHRQVFRHRLATGTTTLLSARDGRPGSAPSTLEALSADGSRVLLTSEAPLTADDVDGERCESEAECYSDRSRFDAFLALASGAVSLVSRSYRGAVSEYESHGDDLLADGSAVVFSSHDTLVPGQTARGTFLEVYSFSEVFLRRLR